jgi:hypothetical protein
LRHDSSGHPMIVPRGNGTGEFSDAFKSPK